MGPVFDNRITTGNILTILGGVAMVGAFIISTRSETVAVNARVDKTDIAQGYMQKQIDEQARNNNDRWSDVKSSMLRIETRIEGISDSMSKKEDRRTQGETKR